MSDDQKDLQALSFEEHRKAALAHPDFFKKLKYVENCTIEPMTLSEIKRNADAFLDEKSTLIMAATQRAFEAHAEYQGAVEEFSSFSKSPIFDGMKAHAELMFTSFSEADAATIQVLYYYGAFCAQLGAALSASYSAKAGFADADKAQFIELADNAARIGAALKNMADMMREKKK